MEYTFNTLLNKFPFMNFDWLGLESVSLINNKMNQLGKPWYFVGGVVRDSLQGIKTKDIDITTTASPDEIEALFFNKFTMSTIGKKFGTIAVFIKGYSFEITTTRIEKNCDGRWADVELVDSFYLDSTRRDFTMNALLSDGNVVVDFHEGIKDLNRGVVKFIGSAKRRLEEDYLRALRYIRFQSRYGTPKNSISYKNEFDGILCKLHSLSSERIGSELRSMVKRESTRNKAIKLFNDYNLGKAIFNCNLPTIPDYCIGADESLAYLAKFIDYKKLGFSRRVKHILFLLQPFKECQYRMAEIWKKFKNKDYLLDFLRLHKIKHKPIGNIDISIDYSNVSPKDRSELQLNALSKFFSKFIV